MKYYGLRTVKKACKELRKRLFGACEEQRPFTAFSSQNELDKWHIDTNNKYKIKDK